jgi:hypothetical protein
MTQSKLGGSKGAEPKSTKLYKCDWSSCQGKHPVELKYPKGGKVTKGGYRDAWLGAGMAPWDLENGFLRDKLWKNGRPHYNQKDYKVQAHHLVPSTLLKHSGTLKHNLELVAYDVDCQENGLVLPEFAIDQPLNRLPEHRGNHPPGYMDPIREELNAIEDSYDGICYVDQTGELGTQLCLVKELHAVADKAKQMILRIRTKGTTFWPLRYPDANSCSKSFFGAEDEYKKREKLRKQLGL